MIFTSSLNGPLGQLEPEPKWDRKTWTKCQGLSILKSTLDGMLEPVHALIELMNSIVSMSVLKPDDPQSLAGASRTKNLPTIAQPQMMD